MLGSTYLGILTGALYSRCWYLPKSPNYGERLNEYFMAALSYRWRFESPSILASTLPLEAHGAIAFCPTCQPLHGWRGTTPSCGEGTPPASSPRPLTSKATSTTISAGLSAMEGHGEQSAPRTAGTVVGR